MTSGQVTYTCALFGKHPAAADHMEDVGLSTAGLVEFKRMLYLEAVEKNLAKGRWADVDGGRLPYGHLVVALDPVSACVAELVASTDAKGRGQYPLVTVVERQGVAPLSGAELRRSRDWVQQAGQLAQAAPDMDAVQSAHGKLARLAESEAGEEVQGFNAGERQRFSERPDLGPDHQGFLRVLHALANAGAGVPRCRVPLQDASDYAGAALWLDLVRSFFPSKPEATLVWRDGLAQIDLTLSPPNAESLKHLFGPPETPPLTTAVPYEMDEAFVTDTKARLRRWAEDRELGIVENSASGWVKRLGSAFGSVFTSKNSDT